STRPGSSPSRAWSRPGSSDEEQLQVAALREGRRHGVIRAGAPRREDAALLAREREALGDGGAERGRRHVARAGGGGEEPAVGDDGGGGAVELAVGGERPRERLGAGGEAGRVADDDVPAPPVGGGAREELAAVGDDELVAAVEPVAREVS